MSIPEAAKKLLAARRQPLRNPEIVAGFKAGGFHLGSKDPVNTVGAVLTRRANDVGDIVKVARGTWGLKEWFPGRSFKKDKAENGDKGESAVVTEEAAPPAPKGSIKPFAERAAAQKPSEAGKTNWLEKARATKSGGWPSGS